jgi:hypothetical protein
MPATLSSCAFSAPSSAGSDRDEHHRYPLTAQGPSQGSEHRYAIDFVPDSADAPSIGYEGATSGLRDIAAAELAYAPGNERQRVLPVWSDWCVGGGSRHPSQGDRGVPEPMADPMVARW